MYIVRWLIGHPIVAVLVLVAVALLLAPKSGPNNTSIVKEPDVVSITTEPVEDKKMPVSPVADTTAKIEKEAKKTVTEVVIPTVVALAPVKIDLGNTDNKLSNTSPVAVDSKAIDSKGTATTDLGTLTSEDMLLMAREAYWNNGLDEAAQIYKKLIEKEPKVLEHKGELGNVYWRQGFPKKAAELYSEIALPMVDNGGAERVANMVGFIGLFYPDRAAEIHKRIQAKQQK